MNNKKIFYSYNKVLSYNALLYFIITERGLGKTYGAKEFVVDHFLKKHKQFVYLRRYKTELKQAMQNGKFFEQISSNEKYKNIKLSNNADTMFIDKKVCGFAIPLSTANILKSTSFEDVDTIIFDEFLIDKGCYHYLQNEVNQLLDIIETIGRLRDIRVFFLGNAISSTNPYFNYFNIHLPYNSDIATFKNGLILVNYARNSAYREVKKKSRFGQLIDGTEYGNYAIDNQFLRDSKSFITKKTPNSKFYFILNINGFKYGVWNDYNIGCMFIAKAYDPNCPIIFSLIPDDHNEDTLLIRCRTSPFFQSLIEHYRLAKLGFENQQIKNNVLPFLMKYVN